MVAKSIDVLVLLKLLIAARGKTYAELGAELGVSASEVHAAVRRGVKAGLIAGESRIPRRKPLEEYLLYGVPYAFPAEHGYVARGMPTAQAAPPLNQVLLPEELPPVWADPEGTTKGYSVEPLYRSVPKAAKEDAELYELLALVDALRVGRARDRKLAADELKKRIAHALAH